MILAIVQARMSSSRLPSKVMKEILGKPVIGYLFERLALSQRIDKVILATSVNPENDLLCQYVESLGIDVFRGSEENVLERYYLAAKQYKADDIVRITGDCPLIDPEICDRLINEYSQQKADYACLSERFAEGLDCEIFKFTALQESYEKATLLSEYEHLTQYMHNHKDQFKILKMDNSVDESDYRIVVDEPEDFKMLESLFEHYYATRHPYVKFSDIRKYLNEHPELKNINAHIIRNEGLIKSLQVDKSVK